MKIVIDIDECVYKGIYSDAEIMIYSGMRSGKTLFASLLRAIRNGTPLPKGYGDLIDRDALSGEIFCNADITDTHTCFNSIDKIVKDAPTIIEADKESEDGNDNCRFPLGQPR